MKYSVIICAGNSRSGSTKQYNIVKQLLKANNLEYIDYGYAECIPEHLYNIKYSRPIALIKCHYPIIKNNNNICYLNIVRCSGAVRSSLLRFSSLSEQRITSILSADLNKTKQMLKEANTLIQSYNESDESLVRNISDFLTIEVKEYRYSIKKDNSSIISRILKYALKKKVNKIFPKIIRQKVKLYFKQYNAETLMHPNHIRNEEYTDIRKQTHICSLCLVQSCCNENFYTN